MKLTAIIKKKTLVVIFINTHNWSLNEANLSVPVKFHLAMELYRDIHWCKVVIFISLLHCVWEVFVLIFS